MMCLTLQVLMWEVVAWQHMQVQNMRISSGPEGNLKQFGMIIYPILSSWIGVYKPFGFPESPQMTLCRRLFYEFGGDALKGSITAPGRNFCHESFRLLCPV